MRVNFDLFLIVLLVAVIVLILREAAAKPNAGGVEVTPGAYGTRIDYETDRGLGCCG
jgi:hypothetical protein